MISLFLGQQREAWNWQPAPLVYGEVMATAWILSPSCGAVELILLCQCLRRGLNLIKI